MQCKRQTTSVSLTSDLQAGRALTLLSIIAGLLGFIVTLLGGGVVNCSGTPHDYAEPPSTSSSKKKAALLGGALCVLSAILCLVSVSWSAGHTIYYFNDPLLAAALKREVGSSIYIGWGSSVLLLLGGALICFVCRDKEPPPPHNLYTPYSYSDYPSRTATLRSGIRSTSSGLYDHHRPNRMDQAPVPNQYY
ncbi:hypothetical protein LDENG_00252160 [Lucifuga dentata]|nr:hypothetical protein LDENG_00252160 [Lucifuga dentata]